MQFEVRYPPRGRSFITSGKVQFCKRLILGGQFCVSICIAERSFSRMKNEETANSFTKDHDIDGIITVCPPDRYTSRPLLVTSLMPLIVCTLPITLEMLMGRINN